MKYLVGFGVALALLLVGASLAQKTDPLLVEPMPLSPAADHVPSVPLDTPQPDSIYYDDGNPALFYTATNYWVRVRFTPLSCFELRSIYFFTYNPNENSAPCSVFVHLPNGNALGALLSAERLPGTVPSFAWNDLDLPFPLTFGPYQDFFVVIGPVPGGGGSVGWYVIMDGATTTQRSGMSTGGHYGSYSTSPADFMIRAGGEYLESFRGSISLISAGPPNWTYGLSHRQGCISQLAFTRFCPGTTGSVSGDAAASWHVLPNGDGNDGDSIIFLTSTPLTSGSVSNFILSHPSCSDEVIWNVGDTSGTIDGPLPVDLTSFEAIPGDNAVTLNWVTASETQNDHFEILRDHLQVAEVPATNNSSGSHYSWTDRGVINGTTYVYTLASVSTTGDREELQTVEATPNSNAAVITEYALHPNYPNPFNPTTEIAYDLKETGFVRLTAYDLLGQPVAVLVNGDVAPGRHTVTFDAQELPSGIYFAQLSVNGFVKTEKMVLMK